MTSELIRPDKVQSAKVSQRDISRCTSSSRDICSKGTKFYCRLLLLLHHSIIVLPKAAASLNNDEWTPPPPSTDVSTSSGFSLSAGRGFFHYGPPSQSFRLSNLSYDISGFHWRRIIGSDSAPMTGKENE